MPTYTDFERKVHSYPYVATPERVDSIKRGLSSLKPCMDKSAVFAVLGAPDFSQVIGGKRYDEWLGSEWRYYLLARSRGANSKDVLVEVFFDLNDHANWFAVRNIEGATDIGAPAHKCA